MRARKKIMWIANFAILALFSVYSLTGIMGFGSSKAYASTLEKDNFYKRGERFMVVDKKDRGNPAEPKEICALTNEQVAELDAFFRVDTFDLEVRDDTVTIAAVSGQRLTKQQLMDYLRVNDADLNCRIVEQNRVFFLPVLPSVSSLYAQ